MARLKVILFFAVLIVCGDNYAGDTTSCQPSSTRFGGIRYLYRYTNAIKNDSAAFGAYTAENDSFVFPNNGLVAEELYKNFGTPGFVASDSVEDLHMGMCFRHNFSMTNTDTLRFYTVLATVRNGTQAELQTRFARGKAWFNAKNIANIRRDSCLVAVCCCIGPIRGDVNGNGALSVLDLNFLIAYMFASGPVPPCFLEADMNATSNINILDINLMVAYFFSGGPPPAACGC